MNFGCIEHSFQEEPCNTTTYPADLFAWSLCLISKIILSHAQIPLLSLVDTFP